ncbi:hypothetical protein PCASD_08415 [Puccinia coronata f. sp. avenae]|uniref:Uncharacterized protein n=1 Tax=Puccinia coronata f. sp. avenae TaxID=200324 RepID=A0A2N5UML2_9BASI|nr:hypothetical protein PCASD_08415 [Puccinia coronata f. sp. avenae]
MRPEDEKRKIVVFNCGQVKITLRDHTNRFMATATTPAIMITDDHKAVAAAAKAKSGSDAEDIPTRTRPILSAPSQENSDSTAGWTSFSAANTTCLNSQSQGGPRSVFTTYKRKAPEELNLRANIGRRTGSNQMATSNQLIGACDDLTAPKNLEYDLNYPILYPPGSSRSLEECRSQLSNLPHSRRYDRTRFNLAPHNQVGLEELLSHTADSSSALPSNKIATYQPEPELSLASKFLAASTWSAHKWSIKDYGSLVGSFRTIIQLEKEAQYGGSQRIGHPALPRQTMKDTLKHTLYAHLTRKEEFNDIILGRWKNYQLL